MNSGGNMAPLALGRKAKALVEDGLGCTGDNAWKGGAIKWQDKRSARAEEVLVNG